MCMAAMTGTDSSENDSRNTGELGPVERQEEEPRGRPRKNRRAASLLRRDSGSLLWKVHGARHWRDEVESGGRHHQYQQEELDNLFSFDGAHFV